MGGRNNLYDTTDEKLSVNALFLKKCLSTSKSLLLQIVKLCFKYMPNAAAECNSVI